jgi:methylase of polypeptide subunit release factors
MEDRVMKNKSQWIGLGIAMGAGVGAALGAAFHQMGPWLAIGIGVGLAIASAMANRKNAAVCATDTQPKAKG